MYSQDLKYFHIVLKIGKNIINEICRVCKVGGYVEFMEKDVELDFKGEFTMKALSRCKNSSF